MREILLIGGGGHCSSCIEAIESTNDWIISGIVDTPERMGSTLLRYKFIGTDQDLSTLANRIPNMLVTVGQLKAPTLRMKLYNMAIDAGAFMPPITASSAVVSRRAHLGAGTVALHGAIVNVGARIGDNCILNTGCIVEHDCIIASHTHISTGAIINGDCEIGSEVMVGSGAIVRNGLKICNRVTLGAGTVVVRDILEPGVWIGIPARRIS